MVTLTMWGSNGSDKGEMNKPEDIVIDPNNKNIYIYNRYKEFQNY